MELLLGFDHGDGAQSELRIRIADDVTVGELADHLAARSGLPNGLTIGSLSRGALVADVGPESGSSVSLVDDAPSAELDRLAPVTVEFRSDQNSSSFDLHQLTYGTNDLGAFDIRVSDRVEVVPEGAARLLVNGEPVIGVHRVRSGDLIMVLALEVERPALGTETRKACGPEPSWTKGCTAKTMMVKVDGRLAPPVSGPFVAHRSAQRPHVEFKPVRVSVPSPPDATRVPAMPILSAVVPLLLGVALWVVTRSLASTFFVVFSFAYVVAAGFEARREFRKEQTFREDQFHQGVARALETVAGCNREEARVGNQLYPGPSNIHQLVMERDERVWERSVDDSTGDFLVARIGKSLQRGSTRIDRPSTGRLDLLDELNSALDDAEVTTRIETVNLDQGAGLGIIGNDEQITSLARWVVLQLAALNGPDQIQLVVVCKPERLHEWRWTAWLPHMRSHSSAARALIVVDGATDEEVEFAIGELPPDKVRLLWLDSTRANLPRALRQNIEVGSTARVTRATGQDTSVFISSELNEFKCDGITRESATTMAMRLAPMIHERALEGPQDDGPERTDLTSIVTRGLLDDIAVLLGLWQSSRSNPRLSAPVAKSGASIVELDLAEQGPHALIAGMTGAGKSELLRTWLTSIALHHPPDKVTFLLVDYKGGAAFGPLSALPHTVGLITDLDRDLADRAMVSLRAELRHRELWLSEAGAESMRAAVSVGDRPPSLIVVVDEFATLAKEIPQFVDELVDIAQRGRSLGIHLILATQRPHGVVSESIRANTALRIALRVADPDDSTDVIDVPDACSIPSNRPGTAIVSVGRVRSKPLRFVYSSGPRHTDARIDSEPIELHPGSHQARFAHACTELEAAVTAVGAGFAESGKELPRPPWVPPLSRSVPVSRLSPDTESVDVHELVLGEVDVPELQKVSPFTLDLNANVGTAFFGGAGAERAVAISAATAAASHQLERSTIYVIGRPDQHATDSIEVFDRERVLRLLRGVRDRISFAARGLDQSFPRTLIVIEDIATFEEHYRSVNRGEALQILEQAARFGTSAMVNLIVGAARRLDLDPGLAVGFGNAVYVKTTSADEAEALGIPRSLAGPLPTGRGYHDGHWIQFCSTYGCSSECVGVHQRVPLLPQRISLESLDLGSTATTHGTAVNANGGDSEAGAHVGSEGWSIPIGLDTDSLQIAHLDLTHGHGIVAGPRRSGCSTTLATLASSARTSRRCKQTGSSAVPRFTVLLCADDFSSQTMSPTPWNRIEILGTNDPTESLLQLFEEVRTQLNIGSAVLLCVDDLPDLLASNHATCVEDLLGRLLIMSRTSELRIILGGEIAAMTRCYSEVVTRVRSCRTGVLLQPDIDSHGTLLGCDLQQRDELPARAGLGWVINNGVAESTQIAVTD
ncbi:MAG: hypothetical protein KDB26_10575 [Microthrixaceae bacterium]|nr:hypothetical protein [Microthrixaceae bacterium]